MPESDPNLPPAPREGNSAPGFAVDGKRKSRLRSLRRFRRHEIDLDEREARRRRIRRHGRRAYIRSVYSLPSLATLGNAICGFAAMYVVSLDEASAGAWIYQSRFFIAAYLIFAAMFFDAIDGRLARFTRHTTDFGGQLDSMADVISFGCAPAFISIYLFQSAHLHLPAVFARLVWAIAALYVSCAAIRLARFNVSNEHGEQHHFSFLGLPSPGAGAAVVAFILMQQDLALHADEWKFAGYLSTICISVLPIIVLVCGLLMVSTIRYPHLVNRYLRGRRSIGQLVVVLVGVLLIVTVHRYTLGIGSLAYVIWGLIGSGIPKFMRRSPGTKPAARKVNAGV
ncbi:MAG TPA: CDP-alcohol phosphatidyltransferase family protein [Tepidisphaeraceae bacterium]|nr:CDP-alcohol phosphatidyltransferase family protein [Tepidisphaeraceae bacterium]